MERYTKPEVGLALILRDPPLDDPTAALGAVNAFSDLGRYTNQGGTLHVFNLGKTRRALTLTGK